jgi:hypothetical protein
MERRARFTGLLLSDATIQTPERAPGFTRTQEGRKDAPGGRRADALEPEA